MQMHFLKIFLRGPCQYELPAATHFRSVIAEYMDIKNNQWFFGNVICAASDKC
jgi:hypothetical protein